MALGRKTGGRKAGTPNTRTQNVTEKLEAMGCDPIEAMARMAMEAEAEDDKTLAKSLYAELAPYYTPKRKAVEQTIIEQKPERTKEEVEARRQEAEKTILEH